MSSRDKAVTEIPSAADFPAGALSTIRWSIQAAWQAARLAPLPSLILFLLWVNLNTGPWNIGDEWLDPTALRAMLPYILFPIAAVAILPKFKQIGREEGTWAIRALFVYGLFALFFSINSLSPATAFYFGINFLATVMAALLFIPSNTAENKLLGNAVQLTWCLEVAIAVCVICYSRGSLFNPGTESSYEIITELEGQSRSSGVGRFIAIPAILALSRAWHGKGLSRTFLFAVYGFLALLVYRLQSRGAIFGLMAATGCILVSGLARPQYLVSAAILIIVCLATDPGGVFSQDPFIAKALKHIQRGQTGEDFFKMTGRADDWKRALEYMWNSGMVMGYGNRADRYLIGAHVHNTWLQALMFGGLFGLIFFTVSWIIAWWNLAKIYFRRAMLEPSERLLFYEAGAVWIFFTFRAIPETTNASFSVDLLVMCPIMIYFGALAARLKRNGGNA